jgi:hypothetical protein
VDCRAEYKSLDRVDKYEARHFDYEGAMSRKPFPCSQRMDRPSSRSLPSNVYRQL